jgi:fibronectin-binding autotransporter adhesin
LTLGGSNTAANAVEGVIQNNLDGGSGSFGKLALTKVDAGTWHLAGANSYTGNTTISGGILAIGDGGTTGSIASASPIINNATLAFDRSDTLTQGTDFANAIAGTGGILQMGTGSTFLTGTNAYTGTTEVSAGTLNIGGSISGTSSVNLTGGTLALGGSDFLRNAATVNLSGGTFATNGFSEGNQVTNGLGALSVAANSTIDFGSGTGSQLWFAGIGAHVTSAKLSILNWSGTEFGEGGALDDRLMFAGSDTSVFTSVYSQADVSFNGVAGYAAMQVDAGHYEIVAVPEPGTIALLGVFALFAGTRRRRASR